MQVQFGLWKTRNNIVFSDRLLTSPSVVIHNMLAFLNHWKMLVKAKEMRVEELIYKLVEGVGAVARPQTVHSCCWSTVIANFLPWFC